MLDLSIIHNKIDDHYSLRIIIETFHPPQSKRALIFSQHRPEIKPRPIPCPIELPLPTNHTPSRYLSIDTIREPLKKKRKNRPLGEKIYHPTREYSRFNAPREISHGREYEAYRIAALWLLSRIRYARDWLSRKSPAKWSVKSTQATQSQGVSFSSSSSFFFSLRGSRYLQPLLVAPARAEYTSNPPTRGARPRHFGTCHRVVLCRTAARQLAAASGPPPSFALLSSLCQVREHSWGVGFGRKREMRLEMARRRWRCGKRAEWVVYGGSRAGSLIWRWKYARNSYLAGGLVNFFLSFSLVWSARSRSARSEECERNVFEIFHQQV